MGYFTIEQNLRDCHLKNVRESITLAQTIDGTKLIKNVINRLVKLRVRLIQRGDDKKRPREDIFCQTIYDLIFKYNLHGSTKWQIGNIDYELKQTEIYRKI